MNVIKCYKINMDDKILLKVKKLTSNAYIPTRGSDKAAGCDLSSAYDYIIEPYGKMIIKTDIAVEIPHGHYGRIAPRSGMTWKFHTDIGAGVIDLDFRGNVGIVLFNHSENELIISKGDKIAQLILEKISIPEIIECTELNDTKRGENGFGSTGISSN